MQDKDAVGGGEWVAQALAVAHRLTFPAQIVADATRVEIGAHELSALLEGLTPSTTKAARRWNPLFAAAR